MLFSPTVILPTHPYPRRPHQQHDPAASQKSWRRRHHPYELGTNGLFGWLVADGWCWFVLREEYCWLVLAGCWWLVCSERKVLLAGG
jgi:hypothetical protein